MNSFRFLPTHPRPWTGRYARIPGETTTLHVKHGRKQPRVVICWKVDGLTLDCDAVDSPDARSLAAAVVEAKSAMGGDLGGSFQINEFGQVLVPASDGLGQRYIAGECSGLPRFQDPRDERIFTLCGDSGLTSGDPWPLPYVGIPYNLSAEDQVYFWREDETGAEMEAPPRLDPSLVTTLRKIRPNGAVRFIVNPEGVILTKRRSMGPLWGADSDWHSVYVCRLDLRAWFDKEE